MVRAMEFRSDWSSFCALPPCFKIVIMHFLLPQFLPSCAPINVMPAGGEAGPGVGI